MATQLRSTRHLSIAGETLDWTEIDPYVWELAFPGGPVIGQIVEIPAHGRTKQTWQRQDTGDKYTSVIVACSDLLTAYYRKQAQTQLATFAIEEAAGRVAAPVLTIVPKADSPTPDPAPAREDRPLGVPADWIKATEAAAVYGVSKACIADWANKGKIASILVPGQGYHGRVRWVAPPGTPAPAQPQPEAVAEPPAPVQPDPAPLADFPSPTIEVRHTPPSDDHPLDALDALDELITPTSETRLLAAMQRIGYLEASLEHWQARAAELEQQLADCETAYTHLTQPRRRWFPFGR